MISAATGAIAQKLPGKPEQVLWDYQDHQAVDMTAMGAFSHTRIDDLLPDSFTATMLTHARKPRLPLR